MTTPQTLEEMQAALQQLLPGEAPEALRETADKLMAALAADPSSAETRQLWAQIEQATGKDLRAVFQAPESFGAALLRALAEGRVPTVSAPTEAAAGQGGNGRAEGFEPPPANGQASGPPAEGSGTGSTLPTLQSTPDAASTPSISRSASGSLSSSVQVSQATGLSSLGVGTELSNSALVTPFVLQSVAPDGSLLQSLDRTGVTTGLSEGSANHTLSQGLGARTATVTLAAAPPPAPAPAVVSAVPAGLLTVDGITVNEGSPFAVFTVHGTPGQLMRLALGNAAATADAGAVLGTDTADAGHGVPLQVYNGSQWVDYAPGSFAIVPGGSQVLLVRTRLVQDPLFEGPRTFTLTATNTDAQSATAVALLLDDGKGALFPDAGPGSDGLPTLDPATARDDDRPTLRLVGAKNVSEGSAAVATLHVDRPLLHATVVELSLAHEDTEPGDIGTTLVVFTDPADPVGSVLTVTDGRFTLPTGITAVYVRVATTADAVYEGPESFRLTAGFVDPLLKFVDPTAANPVLRSGVVTTDTSIVIDDGSGQDHGPGGLATEALPTDQRPALSVAGVDHVSEGSPAVFSVTVNRASEQPIVVELALAHEGTEPGDFDPTLVVFTDPANPTGSTLTVTDGRFTLPPGVTAVYVRVATATDGIYEAAENFRLTAGFVDPVLKFVDPVAANLVAREGATATDTSTVTDDGLGRSHGPGGLLTGVPPTDQRPSLSVVGVDDVSEGSPAVFSLTVDRASEQPTVIELALAHEGTEPGDFDTTPEVFTDPADPVGSALTVTDGRFTLPPGVTSVYVRVATATDVIYEAPENFRLTANFVDPVLKFVDPNVAHPVARSGATATDTSTITDNGLGRSHGPGGAATDVPPTDQRPALNVVGVDDVSEGSPAVFALTVDRASEQPIVIELGMGHVNTEAGDFDTTPVVFTDPADPVGSALTVTNGRFTLPPGVTSVYVRVATAIDGVYEGPESLRLTANFVDPVLKFVDPNLAHPVARTGATASDTATVTDDSFGRVYGPGGVVTEGVATDQRPVLSVAGVDDVSEGSPAVFTVTVNRPSEHATDIDLALAHESTETGDFDPTLVVFTDPADPSGSALAVTNGRVTLPAGVTSVYVRVATPTDGVYEGPETFRLTAGFVDPMLKFVDSHAATPVARTGATASDTSTVTDDGVGRVYGPGGMVTESTPTDQRPVLTVAGVDDVSEGSPAVFTLTVNRPSEQPTAIDLALSHESTETGDFSTTLVVFTDPADPSGSALTVTNGRFTLPAGVTSVYVRVATATDGVYEGPESFRLTAGFVDPMLKFVDPDVANPAASPVARTGATATDTATITDDSVGRVYGPGGVVTGSTPTDQRPTLTVAGVDDVSEGSPAVFTLTVNRPSEQPTAIDLALSHESTEVGDFDPTLVVFTNPADPSGSALTVTNGRFMLPAGVTSVYVRVAIPTDGVYEGPESFRLTAGFVDPMLKFVDPHAASPVARTGATATDTATVTDDSFGRVYGPGGVVTGSTPTDQRPTLAVAGVDDVSEGSPAVFSLTMNRASEHATDVDLALSHDSSEVGDFSTALVVFTDRADPAGSALTVTNGRITLPAGVTGVYVRVATTTDAVYEGPESFRLTASFVDPMLKFVDPDVANLAGTPVARSGATASDTSTILDDGNGRVYGPGGVAGNEAADDDRPTLAVSSTTVNEAAGHAVFSVTLSQLTTQDLRFAPSIVATGSGSGHALPGTDIGASAALEVSTDGGQTWSSAASGVTIAAGTSGLLLRTPVMNEGTPLYEGAETFTLQTGAVTVAGTANAAALRNPAGATGTGTVVDDGTGSVPTGITPDDDRPTLAVTGSTVLEDAGWAVFRVDLNRASGLDIMFTPSVADGVGNAGTATAGTDTGASSSIQYYDTGAATWRSAANGVTIAAGTTSVQLRVPVVDDLDDEADETFSLATGAAQGVTNGTGSGASGTAVIVDNDPSFSFDAQAVTVVEGQAMQFVVNRVSGTGVAVTLDYSVVIASADSSALPVTRSGTVSFSANQAQATITLNSVDDQRLTDDQRLYLSLSTTDDDIRITQGTVSGTVKSNDAEISIRSITASGPDSNGLYTYEVTVERTGALGFTHAVDWSVAGVGENPARNGDFTLPQSQRIEFAVNNNAQATSDTQVITFQAAAGLISDGQRTFEVRLAEEAGSAARVVLGRDAERGTITPNGAGVTIEAVTTNLAEGSALNDAFTQTFRVNLSQAVGSDVVVAWQVRSFASGTSVDADGNDFGGSFPTGTVTIAAGQTSALIHLTPSPDSTVEPNERFLVDFGVQSGPAGKVGPAVIGRIANDDASVQFAFATFSADEGDTGSNGRLVATVERADSIRNAATVHWHVEAINGVTDAQARDWFATGQNAGSQASGLPSGTLTLQPGSVQGEIGIALAGNNAIEAARNFRIVLDNPGTGTALGNRTTATATILDDDARFDMAAATLVRDEGSSGNSYADVYVTRTGDTRSSASVTWTALGTGNDPINGPDLLPNNAAGTLVFGAGESSARIRIAVRPDEMVEADEQFTVLLTGTASPHHALGSDRTTVVTLKNDDATVSFDTTTLTLDEDGAGPGFAGAVFQFQVSRSGDVRSAVSVPWTIPLSGNLTSADFVATSGTVNFAAGASTATLTVSAASDRVVEGDETFSVVLAPTAGSGITLGLQDTATGAIVNDDVGVQAVLTAAPTEGDGGSTSTYTYTFSRTGDLSRQGTHVNWSVAGSAITQGGVTYAAALGNSEFNGSTSGSLDWNAGDNTARTVTVTVNNDSVIEGDEAFALTLANQAGDRSQLTSDGLVAVVHDDDAKVAITRLSPATVTEGAAGSSQTVSFRVTRTGDTGSTLSVDLVPTGVAGATGPSSVTFQPASNSVTLTLPGGQTQVLSVQSGAQYVDVSYVLPGDDTAQGDRNFTLALANPQASRTSGHADQVGIDNTAASATVAVTDDDDRITVTPSQSSITEGNSGSTALTFTLARTGVTSKETIVNWRIQPGTGVVVDANDFTAGQESLQVANNGLPSGRVTFAAGETSKTITVNIAGDTAIEADENLLLNLQVAAGNTQVADTAVTVLTDDAGYRVVARSASMAEGNTPSTPRYMVFDLVRAGVSGQSTVDIFLGGISGADFEDVEIDGVSMGRTLMTSHTFQAGQTGAVVRVRLTQDQVPEGNETLSLMVYDADGEGDLVASGSSVILNDDASLSISAGQGSVSEGTDADLARVAAGNTQTFDLSYTVTRTGYLTQATTVNWAVLAQNGVDAADFANGVLPSGTLSFAAGETSKTITVSVRRDWAGESSEAVTVRLSNASPGAQIVTANATTTVTDDDASIGFAGYTTEGTALAVTEGDDNNGWVNFTFTVQRSGSNVREQEVAWRVVADPDSGITLADFYDAYSQPGQNGGNATPTLPYGTVTFAAGDASTTKTVTIKVRSDTFAVSPGWPTVGSTLEANEPFRVELYNPLAGDKNIGYTVPTAAAVAHAVIVNDDVRIQVADIRTGYAEGRDPAVNGGDVDAFQVGVQRWITQSVTVQRKGDPSQAVSLQWFVDTPGLADRLVLANGNGNLPDGTYGVPDGTSAAGIASGSYANGVLSGLLSWAAGDTADKVLYFTAIPDDDPQPDFRFVLKARPNPSATAESTRIDEVSVLDGADNYNALMGANAPLVLANMVVRRDEAALWISNAVERPYDAATSSYQSEDDAIFGVQTFRANRDAGTLTAQGSDEATREGTVITAAAGQDYTSTSQTLSFSEADRSHTVSVNLRNDGLAESRETFSLFLNGASGASIASSQANVTVIDGDGGSNEYRVAVNDATAIEGVDSHLQFRVDFGKPLSQVNTFEFTINGTAYQEATTGVTADYFRYLQVSADGGLTWQNTAPTFGFNLTTPAPASQTRSYDAVYTFDNAGTAARYDAWMDFTDLAAGQGYEVGGNTANLTFAGAAPPPLDTSGRLYVVVEADGAWVDADNDGVHDASETTLAFDPNDLVVSNTAQPVWKDLIGLSTHAVTIQWNALPAFGGGNSNALDLRGFGNDDKIEIDLRALAAVNKPVGVDNLVQTPSAYEGSPGHPAWYQRRSDIEATATRDGVSYTTTLEGIRDAYGDFAPTDHRLTLQMGSNPKITLGYFGEGYGPQSGALANPNFNVNVSNGLLDQMSFVTPVSTPRGDVWIPVRADAVLNLQALGVGFGRADTAETLRGAFAGVADLGASSTINDEALDFFRNLVHDDNATLADIQTYFNRYDPNNILPDGVKFLKFTIDWNGTGTPTWQINGLDPSVVVAPQNGDWEQLGIHQAVTVDAGATSADAGITLGAGAAFSTAHASVVASGAVPGATISTTGLADWNNRITVGPGADSILVRTGLVDDRIDEIVEHLDVSVRQVSGDTFVGNYDSGRVDIVDNDSPQIGVGTAVVRDASRRVDYLTKIIDINNRAGDTPDLRTVSSNGTLLYVSDSQLHDMGAGQSFTVAVRYQGQWEVAAVSEILETSVDPNYDKSFNASTLNGAQHSSPPPFAVLNGVAEVVGGQPTGFYVAQVSVPAGTYQLLLRSEVGTIGRTLSGNDQYAVADLSNAEQARADSFTAVVGHVDPVIVARHVSAVEADGRAQVEVVAVGGDFNNGPAAVSATTVDGAWVEKTFVVARELSTKGAITATWALDSLGALPEGVGAGDYVAGYYGHTAITPADAADFIALDGQMVTANGVKGTVTFAEGQKEATITVRVRSDDLIEPIKDYRVTITGEVVNGVEVPVTHSVVGGLSQYGSQSFQVIGNPEDGGHIPPYTSTYERVFESAGYGRIENDDRAFSIKGFVFNEGRHNLAVTGQDGLAVADSHGLAFGTLDASPTPQQAQAALQQAGLVAPAGYTLHQFVIDLEGNAPGAASVQWRLYASGIDGSGGFSVGPQTLTNGVAAQAAGAHQAETADFLAYDAGTDGAYSSAYGFQWTAAGGGGMVSVPKTVHFADGQTQAVVTIAVRDDLLAEDAEQFRIELLNPQALEGSNSAVDVHPLRGDASFLMGDDDGGTVSVGFGWMAASDPTLQSLQRLSGDHVSLVEGSGSFYGAGAPGSSGWELKSSADWLASGGYPGADNHTADDKRVVLVFTRSNADLSTVSQAFFEIAQADTEEAVGFTVESGNVRAASQSQGAWRGIVDFAAGESEAYVVLRLHDDLIVDLQNSLTVTLYDAESLPANVRNTSEAQAPVAGWDTAGIGASGAMADWNLTRRDPDAYRATLDIVDDDVRLWLGAFSPVNRTTHDVDHDNDPSTPALVLDNYDQRLRASEGDPTWQGNADQHAAQAANGDFSFTLVRQGAAAGTLSMGWSVVLSGTADATDFNAALFSSSHVNGAGDTVLVGRDPLTLNAGSATLLGTSTLTIAGLFATDFAIEANKTFDFVLGTPTSSTGAQVLFSPSPRGELEPSGVPLGSHVGLPELTIGVTLANDDVRYGIAWNAAAHPMAADPLPVLEGDASTAQPSVVSFDVSRELGGYTAGSSVGWRVVPINGSDITAADFYDTFRDGSNQVVLPYGVVQFAGHTVNASNVETLPAELSKTVQLLIRGDSAVEFGEHFRIELYNPSIGFVNPSAGSVDGVIVNDDTGLRVENTSIREQDSGDQAVTVTLTRVGDLVRANKTTVTTSFDWNVVDLDTNSDDHGSGPYSGHDVQLPANANATHTYGYAEETATISFNVKGDATVEDDEAMLVLLSNVQGIDEVLNGGTGTVTLRNDDTVFSVVATPGFESANQAVVEDAGGSYHFRITRSVATPQDQTVTWSVAATGGRNVVDAADFGGTLPSGTVTFGAGELYKDITFSGVSSDGTAEADEVFQVKVTGFGSGAENDTFAATGNGATGTVVNDDQAVFISDRLPVTQAEGTGSDVHSYRFEVVRSGSTQPLTSTVDWALDFTGTGADASDFTGPTSGTLTFTQDGAQVVEIAIAADSTAETALQDFNIRLSNGSGGVQILTPSVQGILGDDDYTLSVANAAVNEGDGSNQIAFTVTRTGSTVLPAPVSWSLGFAGRTASAADFRDSSDNNGSDGTISGTFTLPAGVSSYTFYVPIQGDTQWEANETFDLTLNYGVGTASAVGTLTNDDEGFSIAAITPVAENSGPVSFRVVREGNLTGSSTVDWSLAGSGPNPAATSGNGNDFAGALSGTVSFADGESTKDVTIALAGDTTWEADEGFTVTLANPGVGSSLKSPGTSSASSQILNDDQGWFVSASTAQITEDQAGNSVTFTITRALGSASGAIVWTLSNPSGDATAVQLADLLVDGQAATSGATSGTTLNFAIGETSKTVTVALAGDATMEDAAQLRMTLTRAGGDSTSNLVTPTANVAVVDDDERLALVSLSTAAVNEGSGTGASLQFKVTREGSSIGAASATWTLAGSGDHPIDASDIERVEIDGIAQSAGALTGTITFADGSMADRLVTVVLRGDAAGEFDEGLTLTLSSPSSGTSLGNASVTHTVLNDDPAVQLLMTTTQVFEGNEGDDRAFTFQVVRTGDLSQTASVAWNLLAATSGASVNEADFGGMLPAGLVSFAAGEATKTVTVVTNGDEVWEPNEGLRIGLSQPSAGLAIIGDPEVAGVLKNDDVQVTIAANSATVREYHANQYPGAYFTLSAQGLSSASSALVSWHVEGTGLNPASASDFAGNVLPSGQTSITLTSGSGSATPGVTIAGDNIYGPDEQFKVVIDSVIAYSGNTVVGGGTATTPSTTITVLDDDLLIGLSQAEAHNHVEGDSGTTTMRFYVDQIARSSLAGTMADVRVDYHLGGDLDGSDVANATGSNAALTLDNASGRYYIGVTLNGDTAVEGTERFTLHLDAARINGAGGGVEVAQSGATAAGRVLDDDFGIDLVSTGSSQSEDGARFVFDVLRTGPTDEAMTVRWTLGTPTLAQGQWGASANDFIDPATGQPYATNASTPITGNLSFAAGESTARFTLEAGHDALPEGDERFAVNVAVTSVDGQALTAQAHQMDSMVGVIVNDDAVPPHFDPAVDQQVHLPLDVLH